MITESSFSDKSQKYFERFLKEQVFHITPVNKKNYSKLMESIHLIIDSIFETVTENSQADNGNAKTIIGKCMGLLSMLVKCNGLLISQDQLVSLQPYFTDETLTGDSLCYYTLQIFRLTLPNMKALKPNFVVACKKSLLKRLTKFNVRELDEAMPCMWFLCSYDDDTSVLAKACISSTRLIRQYLGEIKKKPDMKPDGRLQRLVFLLGNFGRHCNFENHKDMFLAAEIGMRDGESVVSLIVKHLICFCGNNAAVQLKRIAIKNLINVCISTPKLFLSPQILKIMDSAFKEESDISLQDAVINELGTFLELEEKKTIERNGLDNKDSKTVELDVQKLSV
ncbi:unnamed protein product [Ambrosiozyma monospora]|uniref:Unnamed protein product n=1 Tax=Ambrosiozyma monospora TaxID=43982 RepID=A0ACB5U8S7_AMBMO|nr:unnamed protein product [Ambrosiozyma monospora]